MEIQNVYFDSDTKMETVKEYLKDEYQKTINIYFMGYNSENIFTDGKHMTKHRFLQIDKKSDNNYTLMGVYFEGIKDPIRPINENENLTLEKLKNTASHLANPPEKMIIFWRTKNTYKQVRKAIYTHGVFAIFLVCFFSTLIKYIFKFWFGSLN
ncbi:hypothetical protein CWO85_02655 [Candidatus Phytoplasma ziziphi]|uniref:Uncharacterized protein n=1 Tax=Ziziphus jujuba witches'-broom phytoplasma TaxID=135727 RepID=A0A660HNE1_ZIZJU|nr:hypothetical protein [Candidatus Phytoplasma ziziphi]AYJ01389.1 hypothetical protein CWO85_02655 [Candidatus Phytoplasma ziziphi]